MIKKILKLNIVLSIILMAENPIHDLMDNRIKGKSYSGLLDDYRAAEDGLGVLPLQHHTGTTEVNNELLIQKVLSKIEKSEVDVLKLTNIKDNLTNGIIGTSADLNYINQLTSGVSNITSLKYDIFNDNSNVATFFFEGNSNDTFHGYNALTTNISYINEGKFNKGISLSGSSFVSVAQSNLSTIGQGSVSVNAWIKIPDYSGYECIAYLGSFGHNQFHLGLNQGTIWGGSGTGSNWSTLISSTKPALNQWQMITLVINRTTNTLKFYLEGNEVYSNSFTSIPVATNSPILIGTQDNSINYFSGEIDHVRIFNKALIPSEINALYTEN